MKHLRVHELTAVTEKGVSTGIKDKEKKKKCLEEKKTKPTSLLASLFTSPKKCLERNGCN